MSERWWPWADDSLERLCIVSCNCGEFFDVNFTLKSDEIYAEYTTLPTGNVRKWTQKHIDLGHKITVLRTDWIREKILRSRKNMLGSEIIA